MYVRMFYVIAGCIGKQCWPVTESYLGRDWTCCWQGDVQPQCVQCPVPVSHCSATFHETEWRSHCCHIKFGWRDGSSLLSQLYRCETCHPCEWTLRGSEVFMVVSKKRSVFWDMMLCNPVEVNHGFGGICWVHLRYISSKCWWTSAGLHGITS